MPSMTVETKFPWIIFKLGNRYFGVYSIFVTEMVVLPKLNRIPQVPDYIRGVMKLRDKVITVADLRKILKMPTVQTETENLIELLKEREQDHKNWLAELEASVRESRVFKLAVDPHQCKFGKWYDSYKAPNIILENHMKKFDAPHKRIHSLAGEVIDLVKSEEHGQAYRRIEETRHGILAELVNLFETARKLLHESMTEISMVLHHEDKTIGISVDSVESVEYLQEESVQDIPGFSGRLQNHLVGKTAKNIKGDKFILLVNAQLLFEGVEEFTEIPSNLGLEP